MLLVRDLATQNNQDIMVTSIIKIIIIIQHIESIRNPLILNPNLPPLTVINPVHHQLKRKVQINQIILQRNLLVIINQVAMLLAIVMERIEAKMLDIIIILLEKG